MTVHKRSSRRAHRFLSRCRQFQNPRLDTGTGAGPKHIYQPPTTGDLVNCNIPTVRRQEFGEGLRVLRIQAGFTLEDAARIINASASKLSRVETGHRNAPIEDIAGLLALYRAGHDQRTRLLALAREADEIGWLQSHPAGRTRRQRTLSTLESQAERIVHFDPVMVPGLLQTSEYTQAVLAESAGAPDNDDDHGVTWLSRSALIRRQLPKLLAILDESVLHRPFGGREVLRRQLEHLRTAAGESHWTIRVVPRDQKITTGPFTLLHLADRSPVVCLEHLTCALFLERPHDIDAYEHTLKRLDEHALDEAGSLDLIAHAAKSLETDQQPQSPPSHGHALPPTD